MIIITSKVEGFRRAGIAHTVQPKEYPDDKFTDEQLATLKAEPMLIVEVIDEPEEAEPMLIVEVIDAPEEAKPRGGKPSQGKGKK